MIANSPSQKIQLFISCRNLKDLDFFSKSDPYVKVYFRRDFNVKQYALYGQTQTINNDLNPTFKKTFEIDYIFQCKQDIRFDVFDSDSGGDDFIGTVETTIGALMGAKNQTSILDLKEKGKNMGKLIVRCQKLTDSNGNFFFYVCLEYLNMKFKGVKLMNTDSYFDFWDKSDPFLKFVKIRDDNSHIQVTRTQKIMDNLNPSWKPVQIQAARLVNPNNGRFRVECWDWEQDGKDQFIGEVQLKMQELVASKGPMQLTLSNPKKKKPGKIILQMFKIITKPSFIDYLKGGMQLNMIIAIDFTGSNGNPTSASSLHYMDPNQPNQYQNAILSIGNILMEYDSDKRIPSFGFGAQPRFQGSQYNTVSHCFPLSGSGSQLEAMGTQHLMSLYANAVLNVSFSGPTYFGHIIEETMKLANNCKMQGSRTYQTLLILTDGAIHDMAKTIDLIFDAAYLPLSIIIVGIGNADFGDMNKLDGDGGLYNSNGKKAERDIVQFVPFRQVKFNPEMLAKELLAELPGQVVRYMQNMNIPPGNPQVTNIDQIVPMKYNPQQQQQ